MNYSRSYVKAQTSPKMKKRQAATKHFIHTVIKTLLILILIVMATSIAGFFYYVKVQIDKLPDISEVSITPSDEKTQIVDIDGVVISTLSESGSKEDYVELKEIPQDLQDAFIATEDQRFLKHNGVDIRSIIRSAFTGIASGGHFSQGGSTITQQLLKNNYFSGWSEKTTFMDRLERKIQEQYLAIGLEKEMTKDEILEVYLNTINLGEDAIGVESAARKYFNKSVFDLNLSECAVIAAIAPDPSNYNPKDHPRNNALRREKVMQAMLRLGYIDSEEYQDAMDDDVYSRISKMDVSLESGENSFFMEALTEQVADDLMRELSLSETEAYMKLYSGGLTIHATLDPQVQETVDREINRASNYADGTKYSVNFSLTVEKDDGTTKNYTEKSMLRYYKKKDSTYTINYDTREQAEQAYAAYREKVTAKGRIPQGGENVVYSLQPQAAMTVIDQANGEVRAMSGGREEEGAGATTNRATDITRQPGDTFKILASFAPALNAGGMTLASVEDDAPGEYDKGRQIVNSDDTYRGFTTIREAITDSVNVAAVKTLEYIGTGLGYQYVKDFGITTLKEGDNSQSLALGSLTKGVKNVELAAAYAAIANGGYYNRPVYYTTVEDNTGKVILDTTNDKGRRVLKKTTAYLLTSAMEDSVKRGKARACDIDWLTVAGMSGTAQDGRDAVFAGYSTRYTCVIWGGLDDGSAQTSTSYTQEIWKAVMEEIHEGMEDAAFALPDGIVTMVVCKKSGKLPEDGVCDHDPRGSMVINEFFTEESVPTETCDHHIGLLICTASGMPAGDYCPESDIEEKVFITGGSTDTDDGKYLITAERMKRTCDVHTRLLPAQADLKTLLSLGTRAE